MLLLPLCVVASELVVVGMHVLCGVHSVTYMLYFGIILWAIVGRSVLASVGRALCCRFVGGAVVVLLLLQCATCVISGVMLYIRYGKAEVGVYDPYCCRYCCALLRSY